MDLDFLKAEHAALLDLREQLLNGTRADSESGVSRLLGTRKKLDRVLLGHLAKEDRFLYPRLEASSQQDIAALAFRYHAETSDLGELWIALMTAWPDDRIARDPVGFGEAIRPALDAMAGRIYREEAQLYPLYLASLAPDTAMDAAEHSEA